MYAYLGVGPDNGHANGSNGGSSGAEHHPLQELSTPRSPTHVTFSSDESSGSRGTKISLNGLGIVQRLRNKSGSTSGEA